MNCEDCQIAISAQLDGETWTGDPSALREHLASCSRCRSLSERASTVTPSRMLAETTPRSDTVARVFRRIEPDRSTSVQARTLRRFLALIALGQLAVALPQIFASGGDATAHLTRHGGVFSAALAVGFLYAALRPRRCGALLPVLAVLSVGLIVTAIVDVVAGRTPIVGEATHLLEVLGLATVWMLVSYERPRRRGSPAASPTADLRLLDSQLGDGAHRR